MDSIAFSMSGEPRGQGRPRATTRGGFATVYKPTKDRTYERSIAMIAKAAMRGCEPMEGPLTASFRFRMSVPKSYSKRARAAILAGEDPSYLGAYDLDNMVKSALDGMNKIVFVDDKQIVRLWAEKVASETPGVDVKIVALAPQPDPHLAPTALAGPPTQKPPQVVSPVRQGAEPVTHDAGQGPL